MPRMTDRDYEILRIIAAGGGMTAGQVARLFFPPAKVHGKPATHSNARHRLHILHKAGYLRRIQRYQLLSQGKLEFIYALTKAGAELLARWLGCEIQDLAWRQKDERLRADTLEHLVLNNDFRVAVMHVVSNTPYLSLPLWYDAITLKSTHSADKMRITGPLGGEQTAVLVPDDYFVLHNAETGEDKHFFVEVDRATETIKSSDESRRSWVRKIKLYLEYYKPGGYYQQRYGTHKGRMLTITTSEKRLENLVKLSEQAGARQRFWFTTFDRLRSADPLYDQIWQMAQAERLHAIFEQGGEE